MYLLAFILICILVSVFRTMKGLVFYGPSYRTVLHCTIECSTFAMLGLMVSKMMGHPFQDTVRYIAQESSKVVSENPQILEKINMAGLDVGEFITSLESSYMAVFNLLPAMILIISAIVAYFVQLFICRSLGKRKEIKVIEIGKNKDPKTGKMDELVKKKLDHFPPMIPLKDFNIPKNSVFACCLMLLAAYAVSYMGIEGTGILPANVEQIMMFLFAIQGVSVIYAYCEKHRIPKVIPAIATALMLMVGMLQLVFTMLGLLDLCFDFKERMNGNRKMSI